MPRQPTEGQRFKAHQDAVALGEASQTLRHLTSATLYEGVEKHIAYSMCGVLDTAARNPQDVAPELRRGLLRLAAAVHHDATRWHQRTADAQPLAGASGSHSTPSDLRGEPHCGSLGEGEHGD